MKALRVFVACLLLLSGVGCRDTTVAPKTEPSDTTPVMSDVEFQRMDQWVNRMDPFVTHQTDGTFSFDNEAFQRAYPTLAGDDLKTVGTLRDGIAIANETALQHGKQGGDECDGTACYSWWWGKKCCFTGTTAYTIIAAAALGAIFIPGVGVYIAGTIAVVLDYYMNISGGFCVYRYIGGAIAVTPLR